GSSWRTPPGWGPSKPHSDGRMPSLLILFGCGHAALEGDKMNAPVQSAGQIDPWSRRRAKKAARLARIAPWMKGHVLETEAIIEALQVLLEPGDAVALEGDNQK